MIKVYQSTFGKEGDCLASCVASIFEVEKSTLPHLIHNKYMETLEKWLAPYGLSPLSIKLGKKSHMPKAFNIAVGESPRRNGLLHGVVYFGLDFVHDPFPEDRLDPDEDPNEHLAEIDFHIVFVATHPEMNVMKAKLHKLAKSA